MSILHPPDPNGPIIYRCAQSGCQVCLEHLLRSHERLVHAAVWQQRCRDVPNADLLQEGRIALWRAILHFDPDRGLAFSTFAWTAIQRRTWRLADHWRRSHGWLAPPDVLDPAAQVEATWHQAMVRAALHQALSHLPPRLRQVVVAAYGLDGQPPRSLAELGRQYEVTRACVWQWRQEALVLLRLPAVSGGLRRLCDQGHRPAYQRAQALNRAWPSRRRRGGRR
jgi:RNA polymerase sigma factor (sigma-70 family)